MNARSHLLTISHARTIARARGCEVRHYGGRLYVFRDGVEIGSLLASDYLPPPAEPEVSRWSFDRILDKEPDQ